MTRLGAYLSRTIIMSTLFSVLLLLAIDLFFALVTELSEIGRGDYGVKQAIIYLIFSIPAHIFQLFPMASLLGAVLGLGFLANRHELVSMRAAGVSIGQISANVLKVSFIMALIIAMMGEWLIPRSEEAAQRHKTFAQSQGQALTTTEGVWLRSGAQFIYIASVLPDGLLQGITRYEWSSEGQLKIAEHANAARYHAGGATLYQVATTLFKNNETQTRYSAIRPWKTAVNPKLFALMQKDPKDLSLTGLFHYIHYLDQNHLATSPYWLAFWRKIMQPFATLLMVWLGIATIFGPLRDAKMGFRMVIGVLLGFLFYVMNELFGSLSLAYALPPFLGAVLPVLIVGIATATVMRRVG